MNGPTGVSDDLLRQFQGAPHVSIQLCLDPATAVPPAETIRRWFVDGLDQLGGPVWRRVQADTAGSVVPFVTDDPDRWLPMLPPGTAALDLQVWKDGWKDGKWLGRGAGAVEEFVARAGLMPYFAAATLAVSAGPADAPGYRARLASPEYPIITLALKRVGSEPGWLLLGIDGPARYLLPALDGQSPTAAFLRSLADSTNPTFGQIGEQQAGAGQTPLDAGLGRSVDASVRAAREIVRGYSWVTVISQEVGDSLGGLASLASSGAFVAADRLAQGGFWLQATERYEQFDLAAAVRVAEVLGPVLPPGRPLPAESWQAPRTVVT